MWPLTSLDAGCHWIVIDDSKIDKLIFFILYYVKTISYIKDKNDFINFFIIENWISTFTYL